LAAELVSLNPGIIITSGTPCTLALKQATSTVPIVVAAIGNAVEAGAVASLARPGGNITGSTFLWEELTNKRVDILKAAVPRLRRVGLLHNPANTAYAPLMSRTIERLAQTLNVTAQPLQVRRLDELDAAFAGAKRIIDAVVVNEEGLFFGGGVPKRIADLAMQERLPSVGFTEYADPGGLMGYGVSFSDLLRRSMSFVDKILNGAKPAELPVQQPTKFEFVINLRTAKALGLTIPQSLLQRADQVIE
jgi:putative ABC transport system substrate-binding protein